VFQEEISAQSNKGKGSPTAH